MTEAVLPDICLGTVQFGLDYGIANSTGQVAEAEVRTILDTARESGISMLDTASDYGMSEAVLGTVAAARHFRIATKVPRLRAGDDPLRHVAQSFCVSLERLGTDRVAALMVHDADDLLGPDGAALWAGLERERGAGRCGAIGASVYDGCQIDALLDRFPIEIMQLPLNPLDDRLFVGGQIDRLVGAGVEIHARSLFLQGVLLMTPVAIPAHLSGLTGAVTRLQSAWRAAGLTPIEGILAWAFSQSPLSALVFGVSSDVELRELISAMRRATVHRQHSGPVDLPEIDPRLLNPARWHELKRLHQG